VVYARLWIVRAFQEQVTEMRGGAEYSLEKTGSTIQVVPWVVRLCECSEVEPEDAGLCVSFK
jgi:hypothetical protein